MSEFNLELSIESDSLLPSIAEKCTKSIAPQIQLISAGMGNLVKFGFADGLGGLLFSSAMCSENSALDPLIDALSELLEKGHLLPVSEEESFDVFDGLSGLLVGALALKKVTDCASVDLVIDQILDRITFNRNSIVNGPLGFGLAHGLAGVGIALTIANETRGNALIATIVEEIRAREKQHWASDAQSRNGMFHGRCATTNSWCSGVAGYLILEKMTYIRPLLRSAARWSRCHFWLQKLV